MQKTGCPGFDTPCDRALAAPPMDVAQQIEISAAHEPRAGAHQSNCTTTQVVRFPGRSAGNTRFAKEDFSNLAIRCTGQVRVQSTKCKHELLTLQLREDRPIEWRAPRSKGARGAAPDRRVQQNWRRAD